MILKPIFQNIPSELRVLPRWVTWKDEKIPYCATAVNTMASVSDPESWSSFGQADAAYHEGNRDGIGFVLIGDRVVCIDLDHVVVDGKLMPAAIELLNHIGCAYVELSPSGTGIHGWGYGPNIPGRRGKINGISVEIYSTKRYMTCTGHVLKAGPFVELPNFASVADNLSNSRPPTKEAHKHTDASTCHLQWSSVDIPDSFLPTKPGERNYCIFQFARYLKAKIPNATREDLRTLVQEWHRLALPCIGTKEFAVTFEEFMRGWANVKQPYGQTLMAILNRIDFSTPLPEAITPFAYGVAGQQLFRICRELQIHEGENKPFFISCRKAGELVSLHYTEAAKLLATLVGDGVLKRVTIGSGREASRYRMIVPT